MQEKSIHQKLNAVLVMLSIVVLLGLFNSIQEMRSNRARTACFEKAATIAVSSANDALEYLGAVLKCGKY